jgi:hypothetical protein
MCVKVQKMAFTLPAQCGVHHLSSLLEILTVLSQPPGVASRQPKTLWVCGYRRGALYIFEFLVLRSGGCSH